ncbi:MAG: BREX-1 system adenine-specific DNA-methyltransferase PglX, partial [Clostridium sp.]|nr:BREX-1 system adenine-specific DNA-methyltransferase PglX [Clostridium sp.]
MNKSAIKKFATEARTKLLEQVKQKAFELGISEKGIEEYPDSGGVISIGSNFIDKKKRDQLIQRVETKGLDLVFEEMAYTWFNRFIALRFMEVNGYLPTGVRILSSEDPKRVEPEIFRNVTLVKDSLNLDLEYVFELQDKGDSERLFKYLVLAQCNALHEVLPFMFEPLEDYSELLFPNNLLVENSVIRQMITSIDEEDWKEVEIIGWLYQFYVSEKKDEVFAGLKKNKKITKENIPAATQLFTPKWIVQYMVENSVGRLWQESHPGSELQNNLEYYLEPVEQEPEVQAKLDELRNPNLRPEEITVMDPACGSGHILVYAFDVLYQIYREQGYLGTDIPNQILKNNLFGLEIDDRAAQLASFALVMQARGKDPNFFKKSVLPNIISIQEPNGVQDSFVYAKLSKEAKEVANELITTYQDAKNLGSIINPKIDGLDILKNELVVIRENSRSLTGYAEDGLVRLNTLIRQTELLSTKYDVVITNPPYMGSKGMNAQLTEFLKRVHPDTRGDLFAVFMQRMESMTKRYGFHVTVTMQSWMFLSSFEKYRKELLDSFSIIGLTHMGNMVMGIAFGTCATVLQKNVQAIQGTYQYIELSDLENGKPTQFPLINDRYSQTCSSSFQAIPGSPIAYWSSDSIFKLFSLDKYIKDYFIPKFGMSTGQGEKYIRNWYEVEKEHICFDARTAEQFLSKNKKWNILDKGGPYRKWYGNAVHIVNWENDGIEIRNDQRSAVRSPHLFFKPHVSWTLVTSGSFSARMFSHGFILDTASNCLYFKDDIIQLQVLGFLNTKVADYILKILNPTLNYSCGVIGLLPYIHETSHINRVNVLVQDAIAFSQYDWDSFEESWNFERHPILVHKSGSLIEEAFNNWEFFAEEQFRQLKANEEELNRIFIEIYGLEDELTPEVEDEDVTIRRADRERDLKSFVSYAVGCMFGRYSLDEKGLAFAGGDFDLDKYKTFAVSKDNVLPILADRYFEEDIVTRFVEFVKVTFGEETLEENLEYIADSIINRRASESSREAIRRYFLNDFYKDHVRIYKKRPIYWLFKSTNGTFNALVYLHRYDQDTVSRIRTDYLLELQDRLAAEDGSLRQLLTTELS